MKKLATKLVAAVLGWQVRRLYKKADFKVVAVAGSIGKTSSKLAIATVLAQKFRVRSQEGNYNHLVSVPLVFFGRTMPNPYNPVGWLLIFIANELKLLRSYPYDVVVVEVGTDGPGQIAELSSYLKADISVVTAIAPEHMEFFKDLDAVAKEEFSISEFSQELVVNADLCEPKYWRELTKPLKTYSLKDGKALNIDTVSEAKLYSAAAAATVGRELGMSEAEVKKAVGQIKPPAGRMQVLKGICGSTIIDDTYNASPDAVRLALDTLYKAKAPQKIAILGSMNELGKHSEEAHRQIGRLCDPKQLALVVTIGKDASTYLADEAEKRGCVVYRTYQPGAAGAKLGHFLQEEAKKGALILAKGSQNGVFAEEAVKQILADPADAKKLVRQSPQWLKKKHQAFGA